MIGSSAFTADKAQRSLEGKELSSVTFVQDYLQLNFNGPGFTFFIWPQVLSQRTVRKVGEPGYRDTLCSQIGRKIRTVSFKQDESLTLDFEDEITFRVPLRDEDYEGPEAVHFISGIADDSLVVF